MLSLAGPPSHPICPHPICPPHPIIPQGDSPPLPHRPLSLIAPASFLPPSRTLGSVKVLICGQASASAASPARVSCVQVQGGSYEARAEGQGQHQCRESGQGQLRAVCEYRGGGLRAWPPGWLDHHTHSKVPPRCPPPPRSHPPAPRISNSRPLISTPPCPRTNLCAARQVDCHQT